MSSKNQKDEQKKPKTDAAPKNRRGVMVLLVMAVLAGFFSIWLSGNISKPDEPQNETISQTKPPDDPRKYYLEILAEQRPGFRMARLKAYLSEHDDREESGFARLQTETLSEQEKLAWAKLSGLRYNTKLPKSAKQKALQNYLQNWSRLHRKAEIKEFEQELQKPAVTNTNNNEQSQSADLPGQKQSRFSSGQGGEILAGAPTSARPVNVILYPPANDTKPAGKIKTPKIVDVKIKRARPARYPKRARRKNISAIVTLSLDIDERGRVARANLISVQADRYSRQFVKSAKRAALASRFYPKTVDGKPVARAGYKRKYKFVPK